MTTADAAAGAAAASLAKSLLSTGTLAPSTRSSSLPFCVRHGQCSKGAKGAGEPGSEGQPTTQIHQATGAVVTRQPPEKMPRPRVATAASEPCRRHGGVARSRGRDRIQETEVEWWRACDGHTPRTLNSSTDGTATMLFPWHTSTKFSASTCSTRRRARGEGGSLAEVDTWVGQKGRGGAAMQGRHLQAAARRLGNVQRGGHTRRSLTLGLSLASSASTVSICSHCLAHPAQKCTAKSGLQG